MEQKTVIVVGYGFRGEAYTEFCVDNSDKIKVVGVVEPNFNRLNKAKEKFNISDSMCFSDFNEFVKRGKLADCIINATMDDIHIKTALPLLELKYDMLLEKPITNNVYELLKLKNCAKENNCKLIICHVLRYTPFYVKIKQMLLSGEIGKVRHIESSENVAIPHASSAYIRGKWNNSKKCGSSYLLAKCCHDMDLLSWFNDSEPESVASMGGRNYFIASNAPKNSGTRCLKDCACEKECIYSIGKFAQDYNPFANYIWENYQDSNFTDEEKLANLKNENPHGQCVFKVDSDLIDQQISTIMFKDGTTATHTLYSAAPKGCRRIHIYGEKGEIIGTLDDSDIRLLKYDPILLKTNESKVDIDLSVVNKGHAGGDYCIMQDLYNTLCGNKPSISCTDIKDSINGHLLVYASDLALEKQTVVKIDELRR